MDNLTSTYKKASTNIIRNINNEAKNIATNLHIDDRAECMAERQAFVTLKDHKDNKPACPIKNIDKQLDQDETANVTLSGRILHSAAT